MHHGGNFVSPFVSECGGMWGLSSRRVLQKLESGNNVSDDLLCQGRDELRVHLTAWRPTLTSL